MSEGIAVAEAYDVGLDTRLVTRLCVTCSPKRYISLAPCVASTLLEMESHKPMTSILAPPLHPAQHGNAWPAVTPLHHQEQESHGLYRKHIAKALRPLTIMADGPVPVRSDEIRSDEFRVATQSVGSRLKERLLERQDSATKTHGFDLHETQHYLDILDPVFAHEVMELHLQISRSSLLNIPCRNSASGMVAGSHTSSRFASQPRRSSTIERQSATSTHSRITETPFGYWQSPSMQRIGTRSANLSAWAQGLT